MSPEKTRTMAVGHCTGATKTTCQTLGMAATAIIRQAGPRLRALRQLRGRHRQELKTMMLPESSKKSSTGQVGHLEIKLACLQSLPKPPQTGGRLISRTTKTPAPTKPACRSPTRRGAVVVLRLQSPHQSLPPSLAAFPHPRASAQAFPIPRARRYHHQLRFHPLSLHPRLLRFHLQQAYPAASVLQRAPVFLRLSVLPYHPPHQSLAQFQNLRVVLSAPQRVYPVPSLHPSLAAFPHQRALVRRYHPVLPVRHRAQYQVLLHLHLPHQIPHLLQALLRPHRLTLSLAILH